MGNDNKNDDFQIRPTVDLRPFASALHHIEQGEPEKVDPVDVANELREHGASALPSKLVGWFCDYLESNIETRGRKGNSPLERRIVGLHVAQCYDAIRKAQKYDPGALPEAVNIWQSWASKLRTAIRHLRWPGWLFHACSTGSLEITKSCATLQALQDRQSGNPPGNSPLIFGQAIRPVCSQSCSRRTNLR